MKVLLTGGAGFIGYHLAKKLVADGDDVVIYDAFLNFIDPAKSRYPEYLKCRMEFLQQRTTLVRGDIRHRSQLLRTLQKESPECVVHLAAVPIATVSNTFPEDAIDINLNGTANVLESLRMSGGVEKFIFTSSSMVYGNFHAPVANERHPTQPVDVYGATKLSGEKLTEAYAAQYGMKSTIIRPSAVYGPTDANRRVTQIFVENALLKKPITVHNGDSRLDFTYVEDLAEGFRLAVRKPVHGETFNITYGDGRSLNELVDILKKLVPGTTAVPGPPDTKRPERGTMDISKARDLLGYKPTYSLEDGMKAYVEFVKRSLGV